MSVGIVTVNNVPDVGGVVEADCRFWGGAVDTGRPRPGDVISWRERCWRRHRLLGVLETGRAPEPRPAGHILDVSHHCHGLSPAVPLQDSSP